MAQGQAEDDGIQPRTDDTGRRVQFVQRRGDSMRRAMEVRRLDAEVAHWGGSLPICRHVPSGTSAFRPVA